LPLSMMGVVTLLVHQTGGIKYVFSHTMYIPIALAAYFFHVPGGIIAGIIAGLFLGPFMPITVATGEMQEVTNWIYRTFTFSGVGLMLGLMISKVEGNLKRIEWLAEHSPETGLPNLSLLLHSLQKLIEHEDDESRYVLLAIRIKNHGEITSILTFEDANLLSMKYAEQLQSLTDEDTPVYHLFPNTYCLYFKIDGGEAEAIEFIEKNIDKLENPIEVNQIPIFININIGIAIETVRDLVPSSFFRKAKLASVIAQERNLLYAFYQPQAEAETKNIQKILGDIPTAIENDEFELYFQPIVRIPTFDVIGVEALLRWQHPKLGSLLPEKFLPYAENTSLVHLIHDWVIRNAIRILSEWPDFQGSLSVNLSSRLLTQQQWITSLDALLREYQLDVSRMIFEVTESSLIIDREQSIDTLTKICDLGAKVAIDDFGTGYSSFEYINMLPVHFLKIDKRFIDNAGTMAKSQEIVKTIIHLADALGIESIAEGVETKGQLEWLMSTKCNHVQGFFISRPQPCDMISRWFQSYLLPDVEGKVGS